MSEDSAQLNSLLKDARLPDHQEVLVIMMMMIYDDDDDNADDDVYIIGELAAQRCQAARSPGGSNGCARLSTTSCFESQMGD